MQLKQDKHTKTKNQILRTKNEKVFCDIGTNTHFCSFGLKTHSFVLSIILKWKKQINLLFTIFALSSLVHVVHIHFFFFGEIIQNFNSWLEFQILFCSFFCTKLFEKKNQKKKKIKNQ